MITTEQAKELIGVTIQDLPLPSVADILCAIGPDDEDAKTMLNFIKSHYAREQMRAGIDEYFERLEFMNKLYGNKP